MPTIPQEHFDILIARLRGIRETYGDDAFTNAVGPMFKLAQRQGPEAVAMFKAALPDFNFEQFENPAPADKFADEIALIREQMPGVKTQGQFNAVMALFETVRALGNAICESDPAKSVEARQAFEKALDTLRQATELSNKLRDVPEAATSPAAEAFKTAPTQFHENDLQTALLVEIEALTSGPALTEWYAANRVRMDQITTQSLRNKLFDAIRAKRDSFAVASP